MSEENAVLPVVPTINSYTVDSDRCFAFVQEARDHAMTFRFKLIEDHASLFNTFMEDLKKLKAKYDKKTLKEINKVHPDHSSIVPSKSIIQISVDYTDLGENIPNIKIMTALSMGAEDEGYQYNNVCVIREGSTNANMQYHEAESFSLYIGLIRKNFKPTQN